MSRVFVIGNGMTKFLKPREGNPDYPQMAKQAVNRAIRDAGINYKDVEMAAVGYVFGNSCAGQRAVYEFDMSGIPMINVNNNCATGATALFMAAQMIKGGQHECTLAVGFDKMERGSLPEGLYKDRENPLKPLLTNMSQVRAYESKLPFAPQIFGNAGLEHMDKYGTKEDHFVKVAEKNHFYSSRNPYAQFQKPYTFDEIKKSDKVYGVITKLQCCPTSDGAAAAILCSENFVKKHGLEDQAVEIVDTAMTSDSQVSFTSKSCMNLAGFDMSKRAANIVFGRSGVKPSEVQVCELHDCFSANELITYEALGFCPEGKAGQFIDDDWTWEKKKIVINPSGGLISKGHPLGATGLAQCAELCWQLRGMAGPRQVENAKYALQHNIGLGGACVVALYKKYNQKPGATRADQTQDPALLEKFEATDAQKQQVQASPVSAVNQKVTTVSLETPKPKL